MVKKLPQSHTAQKWLCSSAGSISKNLKAFPSRAREGLGPSFKAVIWMFTAAPKCLPKWGSIWRTNANMLDFSADIWDWNSWQTGTAPVYWACCWALWNIVDLFGSCLRIWVLRLKEASSNRAMLESSSGFSVMERRPFLVCLLSRPLPDMPARFIPPRAANRPTHSLQIRVRDLRSRARPVRRTLADCSWLAAWWNLGLLCGGKDFWQWCVHVALAVLQDSQQPIFNSAALWPWVPIIALLIGAVEAQVLLGSPEFLIRQVGVGPENLYFSKAPQDAAAGGPVHTWRSRALHQWFPTSAAHQDHLGHLKTPMPRPSVLH